MEKPPFILRIIARGFVFFTEFFKFPGLFVKRRFLWKTYSKGSVFNGIKTYELKNEELLTRRYLTWWQLKPNFEKLENDVAAIMAIKRIKHHGIRQGYIEPQAYDTIRKSILDGSQKSWEAIIELLEEMTFHFKEIREIIIAMTNDVNGKVRETALLTMEDANFSVEDFKKPLEELSVDSNKKVRERVTDLIYRNKNLRKRYIEIVERQMENEKSDEIRERLHWTIEEMKKATY